MRLAKRRLIAPGENLAFAIPAVALSFFVFAYSTRFGQASILFYYALWLPLLLVDYRQVLGNATRYLWIFTFAAIAFLSIFWSAAPGSSARASMQYLSHVLCALIAVRCIDLRTLILGGVSGVILVLVFSMLFGGYHYDPLDGTYSFVGAFASKNQLGFYASLGIFFAFAALVTLKERGLWMGPALLVAALAGFCLLASQSATSVLTTAAILGLAIGMQLILFLSPAHRKGLLLVASVLLTAGVFAALSLGLVDFVLGLFGKDSTLTGRTYLWQQGIEVARQYPWLGFGYQAYWVQGFSEPERLWSEFYIGSRSGFHFHNTFIETAVETGIAGLLALTATLLITLAAHLKRTLSETRNSESLVLFCLAALLLIRAFVEVDILTPYHAGSFLLYFAAGRLTLAQAVHRQPAAFAVTHPLRSH